MMDSMRTNHMWFPGFSPSPLIFIVLIAALIYFLSKHLDGGAQRILRDRLAKGEVTQEDYRERLALLGPGRGRLFGLLAVAFVLFVALVGIWLTALPTSRPIPVDVVEYGRVPAEDFHSAP